MHLPIFCGAHMHLGPRKLQVRIKDNLRILVQYVFAKKKNIKTARLVKLKGHEFLWQRTFDLPDQCLSKSSQLY